MAQDEHHLGGAVYFNRTAMWAVIQVNPCSCLNIRIQLTKLGAIIKGGRMLVMNGTA